MPPMVTVAQAALESNWGESKLSREANNYFGIKAHGELPRVTMATHECEHGAEIAVRAEFARYGSMLECFQSRDRILERSPVYASAREHCGDEAGFIAEMARHWATDPKYAEKLLAFVGEIRAMLSPAPTA